MGFGMSQLGQKSEGKADIVRPEWCRDLSIKELCLEILAKRTPGLNHS